MKFRNIIEYIGLIVTVLLNVNAQSNIEMYRKLEIADVPSINCEDLPNEFGKEAFETVDEFIKKTRNLDYEIVMYFDYISGEVINCASGNLSNVEIDIFEEDIEGKHIVSIHNHPNDVFSPPSSKNFKIFNRSFEDYELVVGRDGLWILKAKGVYKDLFNEMNIASELMFSSAFNHCAGRYNNNQTINKMCDIRYGNQLLKYVNGKMIENVELSRKEYDNMYKNSSAKYNCRKWITDPEAIRLARERENNPNILSGKELSQAFFDMMGYDVDVDELFED